MKKIQSVIINSKCNLTQLASNLDYQMEKEKEFFIVLRKIE